MIPFTWKANSFNTARIIPWTLVVDARVAVGLSSETFVMKRCQNIPPSDDIMIPHRGKGTEFHRTTRNY